MKRTLLLLLALLCILPAAHAAGPETLYPIAYCFRETDFRADTLSDLNGIFVTSVPEADVATVCLGERVIRAGDVLPVSVLGELELLPVSTGGQEAALCYCPIRGTALGEPAQVTIRIRSAKDAAPKADDAELETYKNSPNDGRLTGSDPEDTNLTFQLAEEPKRGKVELQENGSFVYTPAKNKVGEDSFTFTVTDAAGNVSHPATVRITVKKPSECRAFADLTGSLDQFEAMWTAAAGLTGGRSIGGTLCYLPQETVSRAEFLVMAMELLDVPVDDTLRVSGFADADDAPAWLQPYLASAMRRGIVNGMVSERGLVFRPNEPVTAGQAAVMLQNMLELPSRLPDGRAVLGRLVHAGAAGSGDPAGRRGHERQSHRSGAHALPRQPSAEITRLARLRKEAGSFLQKSSVLFQNSCYHRNRKQGQHRTIQQEPSAKKVRRRGMMRYCPISR